MCENKREQGEEFYAWVFNFDAGEVQFTTQLIQQQIRKSKKPKRFWQLGFGVNPRTVVMGEPLIIGAEPDHPVYYAPAEPMRLATGIAIVPAPRIVDELPGWRGRELLRGLRGDPGLIAGFLSLTVALAWWFWLAHGGEAIGIAQRGAGGLLVSMLVLYMPVYLGIASVICMVVSILPELDFIAMDLQRR